MKFVSALAVLTILSLNAYAKTLKDIYLAGGSCKVGATSESESVYELGYGVSKYFDSGFMWGAELNGGMIDTQRNDGYFYGGSFKLGITPFNHFSIYGIGALIKQDFDNGLSGSGFGYGGGAEYRLLSWLALSGEYKIYNMAYDRLSTCDEYSTILVKVKFTF